MQHSATQCNFNRLAIFRMAWVFVLFMALLSGLNNLQAQVTFQKVYKSNDPANVDIAPVLSSNNTIYECDGGGYISLMMLDPSGSNTKLAVCKMDYKGTITAKVTLNGVYLNTFRDFIKLSDGTFILSLNYSDGYAGLIKFNESGQILWQQKGNTGLSELFEDKISHNLISLNAGYTEISALTGEVVKRRVVDYTTMYGTPNYDVFSSDYSSILVGQYPNGDYCRASISSTSELRITKINRNTLTGISTTYPPLTNLYPTYGLTDLVIKNDNSILIAGYPPSILGAAELIEINSAGDMVKRKSINVLNGVNADGSTNGAIQISNIQICDNDDILLNIGRYNNFTVLEPGTNITLFQEIVRLNSDLSLVLHTQEIIPLYQFDGTNSYIGSTKNINISTHDGGYLFCFGQRAGNNLQDPNEPANIGSVYFSKSTQNGQFIGCNTNSTPHQIGDVPLIAQGSTLAFNLETDFYNDIASIVLAPGYASFALITDPIIEEIVCAPAVNCNLTVSNSLPPQTTDINVPLIFPTATFALGNLPETYLWIPATGLDNPTLLTPTQTATQPGTTQVYTLTVTDAAQCTATATMTVTVNPLPCNIDVQYNSVNCRNPLCTLNDGYLEVFPATNGTEPYMYQLLESGNILVPYQSNVRFENLTNGNYVVQVIDANGCTVYSGGIGLQNYVPTLSITVNKNTCVSTAQGALTLVTNAIATGILWSNGVIRDLTIQNLSAGVYTVTVTDINACQFTASASVTESATALSITATITTFNTFTQTDVQITGISVSNGTPPYSYQWLPRAGLSSSSYINPIVNLTTAGTIIYMLTVYDANGCSVTQDITVNVYEPGYGLSIDVTADKTRLLAKGDQIAYTVSITNNSPLRYDNLTVSADLSSLLDYKSDFSSYPTHTISVLDIGLTTDIVLVAEINTTNNTGNDIDVFSNFGVQAAAGGDKYEKGRTIVLASNWEFTVSAGYGESCRDLSQTDRFFYTLQTCALFNGGALAFTTGMSATITIPTDMQVNETLALSLGWQHIGNSYVFDLGTLVTSNAQYQNFSCNSPGQLVGSNCCATLLLPVHSVGTHAPTLQFVSGNVYGVRITGMRGGPLYPDPQGGLTLPNPSSNNNPINASFLPVSICEGQQVTLSVDNDEFNTYLWYDPNNNQITACAGSLTCPVNVTRNFVGGSYRVTGVDPQTLCTVSTSIVPTVIYPNVPITLSTNQFCESDNFSVSIPAGFNNITWSKEHGGLFAACNGLNPCTTIWTNFPTEIISVQATNIATGCISRGTITVTPSPTPIIDVNTRLQNVCTGAIAIATATGAGNGGNYVWTDENGNQVGTTATVTINPVLAGRNRYTVTGTSTAGCSATDDIIINGLNIFAEADSPTICAGASTDINAFGGDNYTWTPATGLNITTGATVIATPAATTTYVVTGTDATGCVSSMSVTITVNPMPTATITSPSASVCTGGNVVITAATNAITPTYVWKNGTTVIPNETANTYSATATGTYTVEVTENGCTATSTAIAITVNPTPTATITAPSTSLCTGGNVLITSATNATTPTYVWRNGATVIPNETANTYSATAAGTYTVEVTENGCTATSAAIVITVGSTPTATITSPSTSVCAGGNVLITAATNATTPAYVWKNGTTVIPNETANTYSATATGTYTVEVTENGCTATSTAIAITVNPTPTIVATATNPIITAGGATLITATGAVAYTWSPTAGLNPTTGAIVVANPTVTTTYTVTGTTNGCTSTTTVTITVNPAGNALAIVLAGRPRCSAFGGSFIFNYTLNNLQPGEVANPWSVTNGTILASTYTTATVRFNSNSGTVSVRTINNRRATVAYPQNLYTVPANANRIPTDLQPEMVFRPILDRFTISVGANGGFSISNSDPRPFVFSNIDFVMGNGSRIVIDNGQDITFINCRFYSNTSNVLWQGITVTNGRAIFDNCSVEHAVTGVNALRNAALGQEGDITAINTCFNESQNHVIATNLLNPMPLDFIGCSFSCISPLKVPIAIPGNPGLSTTASAIRIAYSNGTSTVTPPIINIGRLSTGVPGINTFTDCVQGIVYTNSNQARTGNLHIENNTFTELVSTQATIGGQLRKALARGIVFDSRQSVVPSSLEVNNCRFNGMNQGVDYNTDLYIYPAIPVTTDLLDRNMQVHDNVFTNIRLHPRTSLFSGTTLDPEAAIIAQGGSALIVKDNQISNSVNAMVLLDAVSGYVTGNTISNIDLPNSVKNNTNAFDSYGYGIYSRSASLGGDGNDIPEWVYFLNNTMTNAHRGIYSERVFPAFIQDFSSVLGYSQIDANTMTGIVTDGIRLLGDHSVYSYDVLNDPLANGNWTTPYIGAPKHKATLHYNNITMKPVGLRAGLTNRHGIWAANAQRTEYTSNLITFGMQPVNGNANFNTASMLLENSPVSTVTCNAFRSSINGFMAKGVCDLSPLNGNVFDNLNRGIVLNNGSIGAQGGLHAFRNIRNFRTFSRNSNGSLSPITPITGIANNFSFNVLPTGLAGGGAVPFTINPSGGAYNPVTMNICSTAYQWSMWPAKVSDDGAQKREKRKQEYLKSVRKQKDFLAYKPETQYKDEKFVFEQLANDDTVRTSSPELTQFYQSKLGSPMHKLLQVRSFIKAGKPDIARSITNAVQPTNTQEANAKAIYDIILSLNSVRKDTLPADKLNILRDIALQCPLTGGEAVYQARVLRGKFDGLGIQYDDDCMKSDDEEDNARIGKDKAPEFAIYPNPARTEFTVSTDAEYLNGTAKVQILNVTGSVVVEYTLNNDNTSIQIPVQDWANGVYICKITTDSHPIIIQKIVVQH